MNSSSVESLNYLFSLVRRLIYFSKIGNIQGGKYNSQAAHEQIGKEAQAWLDQYCDMRENQFLLKPDFFELQKEQMPARGWQILSFKERDRDVFFNLSPSGEYQMGNNLSFTLHQMLHVGISVSSDDFVIWSVKRLSDDSVFTVGQKVKIKGCPDSCDIMAFDMISAHLVAHLENKLDAYPLDKLEAFTPVLTTEDQVDIFEGDVFYVAWKSEIWRYINAIADSNFKKEEEVRYFSTKELAKDFVMKENARLIINDLPAMGFDRVICKDIKDLMLKHKISPYSE